MNNTDLALVPLLPRILDLPNDQIESMDKSIVLAARTYQKMEIARLMLEEAMQVVSQDTLQLTQYCEKMEKETTALIINSKLQQIEHEIKQADAIEEISKVNQKTADDLKTRIKDVKKVIIEDASIVLEQKKTLQANQVEAARLKTSLAHLY